MLEGNEALNRTRAGTVTEKSESMVSESEET